MENKSICPIRHTLDIIGGKWKLSIICMLYGEQPSRYSTIKRKLIGITNMMLSQSLKELEASGLVLRKQYNQIPPKVEYTLTELGNSLVPPLKHLANWGRSHMSLSSESPDVHCDICQNTK